MWFLLILLLVLIAISGVAIFRLGFAVCKSHRCLVGKTAIVTGGNSGIGYETCLNLASRGCKVIIADVADSEQSRLNIIQKSNNPNIHSRKLNLASFKSVREFAQEINKTEDRLDILVNNAGILMDAKKVLTEDGFNMVWQVNYLSPFLLTHLLVNLLRKSTPSRIVFTASLAAYHYKFDPSTIAQTETPAAQPYGASKVATLIASDLFAQKLRNSDVTCNAVHPGLVGGTNIGNNQQVATWSAILFKYALGAVLGPFTRNPWFGAQTTVHAAIAEELDGLSGEFFADCKKCSKPSSALCDRTLKESFWQQCENYVKLNKSEKI